MNPVFWLIIIVILGVLWFCLSFVFRGIGKVAKHLYADAKEEIERPDGDPEKSETNIHNREDDIQ